MTPTIISGLSRPEWLARRQQGIGASDMPTILGMGYEDNSPAQLYASKISPYPIELDLGERGALGTVLEPYNAMRFAEETNRELERGPSLVVHPDRPWQFASLDYIDGAINRPVEMKAIFSPPSHPWGDAGTDHVPEKFLIQATQQAGIVEAREVCLSVLFVGYCYRRYTIPFDPDLFDILTAAGSQFWEHVERRREIGPDWQSSYAADVESRLATVQADLVVELDDEADRLARQFAEFQRIKSDAEKEQQQAKALLLSMMGDAGLARLPSGAMLTRKIVKRKGYTVDPTEYLDFRIKQPKGGK